MKAVLMTKKAILVLSLVLMAGCASVDCDPMCEVAGTAFYATTNTTSAAFWEFTTCRGKDVPAA